MSPTSSVDSGPPSLTSNIELLQSFSASPLYLDIEQLVKAIDGVLGNAMKRAFGG